MQAAVIELCQFFKKAPAARVARFASGDTDQDGAVSSPLPSRAQAMDRIMIHNSSGWD